MKYYQYISDSKVDMLLPQLALAFRQKIAGEIGFDLKILSAKLKGDINSLDDRISRLAVVANYIAETQQVGTIQEPASWIRGTLKAKFGYLGKDLNATCGL